MKVACSSCGHQRANHKVTYNATGGGWMTKCKVVGCACHAWSPTVVDREYAMNLRGNDRHPGGRLG